MKAMILAAGRGERMRPITDTIPKALIEVAGKPLIVWHLMRLSKAGIYDIVINHAHLGGKIETLLGNGSQFGLRIQYSREQEALETAGGIAYALPLLGESPFLAINADIYCDFDFSLLNEKFKQFSNSKTRDVVHLVLVKNPEHNASGDFALDGIRVSLEGKQMLTYSGIGIYVPQIFLDITRGKKAKLAPLLREKISQGIVSGEYYDGYWVDVGTPKRLKNLQDSLTFIETGFDVERK